MATGNAVPPGLTPWPKGVSGNPRGSATGSRHRVTRALENLFDKEGPTLSRRCIKMALEGDVGAMRLVLERILPPRKDRPVHFPLPRITSAEDAAQASAMILAAVSAGELTPAEGVEISKLVDTYVRAAELSELEKRVARLEGKSVQVLEP